MELTNQERYAIVLALRLAASDFRRQAARRTMAGEHNKPERQRLLSNARYNETLAEEIGGIVL